MTWTTVEHIDLGRSVNILPGKDCCKVGIHISVNLYNTGDNLSETPWRVCADSFGHSILCGLGTATGDNKEIFKGVYSTLEEARTAFNHQSLRAFVQVQTFIPEKVEVPDEHEN